jgi:hypothetical protein
MPIGITSQDVEVDILVDPAALTSVALDSAAITTPVGLDEEIFLLAKLTDGTTQDVTSQSTWDIDDPTLITIADGQVMGVRSGVSLVHASYGGQTATTQVTVSDAALISIITDPTLSTIPISRSTSACRTCCRTASRPRCCRAPRMSAPRWA